MANNPFSLPNPFETKPKKKRVKLTSTERIYIWEHPEIYGASCNICHRKIEKLSELELDHTKAYSKGGKKLALAHRDCNRMKGNKNLKDVQKKMGIKTTKKKKQNKPKTKPRKKKIPNLLDFPFKTKNPLF
jgi:5-methylcytosine-specific restriction endonuclease McrA